MRSTRPGLQDMHMQGSGLGDCDPIELELYHAYLHLSGRLCSRACLKQKLRDGKKL
jgi:hypothetical protein